MNKVTLSMVSYWRNSLADAELGKGAWGNGESMDVSLQNQHDLISGKLSEAAVQDLFKNEPDENVGVEVAYYPLVYRLKTEHGSRKQFAMPKVLAPVVAKGILKRDGTLVPLHQIFIARDILEPIDKNIFTIGHIDDLDIFLTTHRSPIPANVLYLHGLEESDPTLDQSMDKSPESLKRIWNETLRYCFEMLECVSTSESLSDKGYLKSTDWFIKKAGSGESPSRKITSLYDHMRQANPPTPLLDTFASLETKPVQKCIPRRASMFTHYGHSSDKFPLSDAQRDAVTQLLASESGDVLAVNGPPGTGKTSLILSVVSSLWVKAAINGGKPPVIVASSTNNQAVTNIIDAFKRDFSPGEGVFAGRWIPKIDSFGMYMSSRLKKSQNGKRYITDDFLHDLEAFEFIEEARSAYLESARKAFPMLVAPSVASVVRKLHLTLKEEQKKLTLIGSNFESLSKIRVRIEKHLGANPWQRIDQLEDRYENNLAKYKSYENVYINLINHIGNEPFWYEMFDFLPPVSKKRAIKASMVVKRMLKGIPAEKIWENVEDIKQVLIGKLEKLKQEANKSRQRHLYALKMMNDLKAAEYALVDSLKVLAYEDDPLFETIKHSIDDANTLADTCLRFKMFLLAVHYWEGRWLLEVDGNDDELLDVRGKRGKQVIEDRWRRRMMLTPCAVSTFFMLPGEMRFVKHEGEYISDYLYNFIDLLIIDEAGQVLPEVAAASFSLAKKALVIGDVLQIEPIWNIPRSVDIGNLIHHGGLPKNFIEQDLAFLESIGKTSSSGNVMTIAQSVSRYHYDKEMPRGMFLYEHRRCYDEIVAFCNALCYKNRLIPRRGKAKQKEGGLPPLGYIDVKGICKTKSSGTRFNSEEAKAIALWISTHRTDLEQQYGLDINSIIGVVTPFSGQVDELKSSLKSIGIDINGENGMTVGTVHSLQGAERKVIIFSPTYSLENDGKFIDSSPSMLNVAVSRAQDSFLVFGDMQLFDSSKPKTPRGLLGSFLQKTKNGNLNG